MPCHERWDCFYRYGDCMVSPIISLILLWAITSLAIIATSIFAALYLESSSVSLSHAVAVSLIRYPNNGPRSLLAHQSSASSLNIIVSPWQPPRPSCSLHRQPCSPMLGRVRFLYPRLCRSCPMAFQPGCLEACSTRHDLLSSRDRSVSRRFLLRHLPVTLEQRRRE